MTKADRAPEAITARINALNVAWRRHRDIIRCMAQLVVRQLDDDVKEKLQRRARRHGRSTEEEVREILRNAVRSEGATRTSLGSRVAARFHHLCLGKEIPELRGQSVLPAVFEP